MKELTDMKELLEEQLRKINRKGEAITSQDLESAYKIVDIIKDIETINAMKRSEENNFGASYDNYTKAMNPYITGTWEYTRYPREYYENMEESYARGRSPMTGRYMSKDSYSSSEDEKEQMKRSLEEMKKKIDNMK